MMNKAQRERNWQAVPALGGVIFMLIGIFLISNEHPHVYWGLFLLVGGLAIIMRNPIREVPRRR